MSNDNSSIKITSVETLYDKTCWKATVTCERGFGNSIAMMLRSTLMSRLPSYRIIGLSIRSKRTSAKDQVGSFKCAKNVFCTLSGIGDDVLTIISKLQGCVFAPTQEITGLDDQYPQIQLSLRFNGAGKVLASHFEASSEVKIINGEDIEITTVDPGYTLDLMIQLGYGVGFVEANQQNLEEIANDFFALPMENVVKIESFHSDVEAVFYTVSSSNEYDSINLSVESSRAFGDPEKIMGFIFEYVLQLIMPLAGYNLNELLEESRGQTEVLAEVAIESHMLQHSVKAVGLGGRTSNLEGAGLHTVGDLIKLSRQELLQISGIGDSSIDKIKIYLNKVGLRLKEDYGE
jgi:DNA-directed RNA polymerase subunit alpha